MIERKAGKAMAGRRAVVTVTGAAGSHPKDKELVELVLRDAGIFRRTKLKGKETVLEAEQKLVSSVWITMQGSSLPNATTSLESCPVPAPCHIPSVLHPPGHS